MKKIVSILSGVLCAFTFFVNADEVSVESQQVVEAPAAESVPETQATSDPVAAADATPDAAGQDTVPAAEQGQAPKAKEKGSWWDVILKLFKISDPARTSDQAYNDMVNDQNVVIDFSNVSDFAQNGDAKMTEYYQKIKATNSFGSKSPNIYVNLSKTGVLAEFIAKWSAEFAKDKKNVIWNLSDNPNLDDSVIDVLDLPSIYSLNLSGTSVTDAGIAKIGAMLETHGIGRLVFIHLSGSKVTDAGVEALKASMQKAVEAWKAKNPGKDYKLQGTDGSGVVFAKIPVLPKKPMPAGQKVSPAPDGEKTVETAAENASIDPAIEATTAAAEAAMDATQNAEQPASAEAPAISSVEGKASQALNEAEALVQSATESISAAAGTTTPTA